MESFSREYLMVFGWFKNLSLSFKIIRKISEGIKKVIKEKIEDKTLDDLEELLISSDLGQSSSMW